jgi:ketosteroid isomerase-like protein
MPEMPATHKKIGMFMTHKLALNDANKVTEEWGFADPATMMFQLGLAPKDAPPHRAAVDKGMDLVTAVAADDAKEKANVDVAKKADEAFSAHKAKDLLALFTDDAVESDMVADKDHAGKKEIEKALGMFLAAFSDAKATADTVGMGDYTYAVGTFEGTNDHDMGKMKKTGKHVAVKYVEICQMKDGKIAHLWRFYSGMDFAMQLGMMGPPPGTAPAGAAPKGDAPKGDKKADKK